MMAEENHAISDFISDFKDIELSSSTLFKKEAITTPSKDKLVVISEDILDKYTEDIEKYITTIELSVEEEHKFFYNPHAVSYEYYNTPHLWFLVLRANQIYSKSQLNMNPMKIYDESILDVIKTIINLEQVDINRNKDEISSAT